MSCWIRIRILNADWDPGVKNKVTVNNILYTKKYPLEAVFCICIGLNTDPDPSLNVKTDPDLPSFWLLERNNKPIQAFLMTNILQIFFIHSLFYNKSLL